MRDVMVLLLGVTIAAASLGAAAGQTRPAKSGQPIVIWNWFDCRMGDRLVPISGRAANGTVTCGKRPFTDATDRTSQQSKSPIRPTPALQAQTRCNLRLIAPDSRSP